MHRNLVRRLSTIGIQGFIKALFPARINVLLNEGHMAHAFNLDLSVSVELFSVERRSGVERIDSRLTPHNFAYVVYHAGEIIHESWVSFDTILPSQYGFNSTLPVIAHSSTAPKYRGKFLYPYTLNYILDDLRSRKISTNAYVLVSPSNAASIKAIEKAGFKRLAELTGVRVLGLIFKKSVVLLNNHQKILKLA